MVKTFVLWDSWLVSEAVTKGGVSKCQQMQTNADKRWQCKQAQSWKRKQSASKRANTDKCKRTLTPPFSGVSYTPFAFPYLSGGSHSTTHLWARWGICKEPIPNVYLCVPFSWLRYDPSQDSLLRDDSAADATKYDWYKKYIYIYA